MLAGLATCCLWVLPFAIPHAREVVGADLVTLGAPLVQEALRRFRLRLLR